MPIPNGYCRELAKVRKSFLWVRRRRSIHTLGEASEGFNRQSFRARTRVNAGLSECRCNSIRCNACSAKIVGESLPLLRKYRATETKEGAWLNVELFKAWCKTPAKNGGVHVRWWREG